MQQSLTFLYEAVLGIGTTYVGLGFLISMVDFWRRCAPDTTDSSTLEVNAIALPEATTPMPFQTVQPAVEMEPILRVEDQEQVEEQEPLEP